MAASHRLKLLVIIAAVVSAFRMCEHHVSKMMEVIEKESVMELVEVWYQWNHQTKPSDENYGGVGIVIAANKVLTSAHAVGWISRGKTWNFIDDRLVEFPGSDYDPDFEPVRWFVETNLRKFNAYPVLIMPKGYDIAVLHVEGLTTLRYPKIVDARPKNEDCVRVWKIFFVPRRSGKVSNESMYYLRVLNSEVKHTRRFRCGWNRIEVPVTLILAKISCENAFLAPSMPSGAPIFNEDGLCGVVLESQVYREENGRGLVYTWIEPLNEVRREIEAVLTRR